MTDSELPADYFAKMYAAQSDPWDFESRWYEQRKYALSAAMLPKPRYRRAFEPGCSIGVLTEKLAERCDSVLATDIVPAALESARARLTGRDAEFRLWALGDDWPDETFDLVVISEVGYYLTFEKLIEAMLHVVEHLSLVERCCAPIGVTSYRSIRRTVTPFIRLCARHRGWRSSRRTRTRTC